MILSCVIPSSYKNSLHSVTNRFWVLVSISSQDLIVFFCSFGVALVALNLYKLTQPAKG